LAPGAQAVAGGEARVRIQRTSTGGSSAIVAGSPTGTRLELGTPTVEAAMLFDTSRQALTLSFATGQSALVIAPADGDGFLAQILPSGGLRLPFDLGLSWASDQGLSLHGGVGLATDVPVSVSLGPLALKSFHLALQAAVDGSVNVELSATM